MSSTVTTPTTPAPDPTGVSGSWTPDPDVTSHPLWQRVKDAVELPVGQYDQKYAADDAAVQDKINSVLGHLVPFYKEVSATQPAIEKTKLGKQTSEFVKDQLAHPEQIALGGEFGGETVPGAAIEGAAKIGEHLKETGKTAAKAAVEEGKAAIAAKAPAGSAEAGSVGGAGTAPAKDFSSVGGVKVERRAPDSPFRTPGTTMKKVADQSYAAMREHGIDTTPAPVETKLEEPSGKFASLNGVEQRAATTFGRTGGSFGRTVDQTYDVLRAQEKPADENIGGTDYGAVIGPSKKAAKEAVEALAEHDAPEIVNAIHPDLQKLSDKYGVSDDPEKVRNGASFIRPDGQFIHLPAGTEHPQAIEDVARRYARGQKGIDDSRVKFLADTGAVRTRFHMGRGGQTLSVSVPENGVTPDQIQALKDGFRTSMDGGRGNLVMEVGTPNGKSTQADYVTANEIEPALARIGAMPNQRVNLSDAYGDTGIYIGGHVPLQAGKDFPGNFEKDNFTSRRTTGNNMFDPEGFITGEEMAKGMTPANSHREFPSEADYQNTVHSRGVNVDDVVKKYPRVFNDPAMANLVEQRGVNWDAQAKGAPEGVTNRQRYTENLGVTHGPDLLDIPQELLGEGSTPETLMHHEVAHIVAAHLEGLPTDDTEIRSPWHPDMKDTGAAGAAHFNFSKLPGATLSADGKSAKIPTDSLREVLPKLLRLFMAGGAGEQLIDGTSMLTNRGMGGDLNAAEKAMRAVGLSRDELQYRNRKAMGEIKDKLNSPEILDIIKNASKTREESLSKTLLMSKERVQRDIIQKLNEVTSGKRTDNIDTSTGDAAGTVRGADQGIGEAASSREGQVSGGVARGDEPAAVQGSLFSDASPKMKERVADTPWTEDEHTGYRKLEVKGEGFGNDIGELQYSGEPGDENARIRKSFIEPGYRDQGIAKEMYKSAIEDAKKLGVKTFKSDTMVSKDAQRVWDSLIREGKYNIKKVATDNMNEYGQGGVEYHVDLTKPAEIKNTVESSKAVAAKEDDPYDKIVDLHNENGGATWNLAQNKNLSGTDNYAVSTHPDRTLPVKGELTPEIVKSFAEKNADLLKDPTESLGTWNDKANNQHVLDVVKTTPDRAEAVKLGFEHKQDAIYDLKKTDGTGEIRMEDEQGAPPSTPLPEDYQAKVAAIRQTHGDDAAFNELAQTLPAKERAAVGKVMRRNILDAFAALPQGIEDDATEAAKAGAIQKGWYQHTATLIKSIFGGDTKLFSNILASLSPMMGVRENFIAALKFYADWHAAGRPTSGKALDALTTNKFMKTHALNLIRSVNGEDITGPKVSQFAKNVRGHLDAITNDRWMQFFTGNPKAWSKSKMAASDIVVRRVAQNLGWKPAEVQETIWSFVKPVVELSEKEGVSPSEKAKTITDTEVREGAGSFANLLSDPVVRESFDKIADATGDGRFRPSSIESSRSFKRVQKSTPAPTGKPVGGSADVLGRVGERTAATRTEYLQKGIAKLGEERQPGDEDE